MTRVPSVPLVTNDPYFSLWSPADRLYEAETEHWSGAAKPVKGIIMIDEAAYRFMGGGSENCITQTSLIINPTSTIYTFEGGGVEVEVKFTSPLLLNDLRLVSRPCTYLDFSVKATDGKEHSVKIRIEIDESICYNEKTDVCGSIEQYDGIQAAWVGKAKQSPLNHSGDWITIDWGYFYLASGQKENILLSYNKPENQNISVAAEVDFAQVCCAGKSEYLCLAYDDVLSIMYFEQAVKAYWAKDGKTIIDVIKDAILEHDMLLSKCEVFDRYLRELASEKGGEEYELICSLAYRQTIAAHKLILDGNGDVIFLSKECDSNGCIGTVDVSYPSTPLYLMYNTELVKGMLRPIFKFARLPVWGYDFAPHDVGRYPYAVGQVYGLSEKANKITRLNNGVVPLMYYQYDKNSEMYAEKYQMPVEECGNMIIMSALVTLIEDNVDFAAQNLDLLEKWVCYLVKYGQDPSDQLCTDDFAGHLSHNVNLSAKAIMGVACYSLILDKMGRKAEAQAYKSKAEQMARQWEMDCDTNGHTSLTFDNRDSWSLKYNLIWDMALGMNLFSKKIYQNEITWYKKVQNQYGVPLDSRKDYTKSDWILWCAGMATDPEDIRSLIKPIYCFLIESESRVAFSDWYDTVTGKIMAFKNRTVQGGLFMPLLVDFLKERV